PCRYHVPVADFTPPTPEQLAAHLQRHPPRPPSRWTARAPLIVMIAALVVAILLGNIWAMVLPWAALLGVFLYLVVRVRGARGLEQRTTRVQELSMLRRYPEGLRRAWTLVPRLTHQPTLYIRCVALLSQCLHQLKAYDAAIVGYDGLLEHLPHEYPGAIQLRAHRALAALHGDRLADADDTLRQLRNVVGPYAHTTIGATVRLAELTQATRTHHYTDPLDRADRLLEELRPLGVEAGYGHALLALCHREDRSERDETGRRAQVQLWWNRATTLLPEAALLDRYPELTALRHTANPPTPDRSDARSEGPD
ncbi:MAG: hypothetical protein ACODAQ_12790, partial [Phycisphaeraceae bacterium]